MTPLEPTVFVVDDDEAVREALELLIRSFELDVEVFPSAGAFLESGGEERPGCLVLDIRMPGMSGPELQEELTKRGSLLPIIFITGHGDVPVAVEAMRAGAVDFLQKPFSDGDLLHRIQQSIEQNREAHARSRDLEEIRRKLESLTPREREVLEKVAQGAPNKAIAYDLDLSERTVEIHRSRAMRKMDAQSVAEVVQMILRLGA